MKYGLSNNLYAEPANTLAFVRAKTAGAISSVDADYIKRVDSVLVSAESETDKLGFIETELLTLIADYESLSPLVGLNEDFTLGYMYIAFSSVLERALGEQCDKYFRYH